MSDSYTRIYDWSEDDTKATVYLSRRLRVRLTDLDKNPLPYAKCRFVDNKEMIFESDERGIVMIPLNDTNQRTVELEWEPAEAEGTDDENRFFWRNVFQTDIESIDDAQCVKRLANLGFSGGSLPKQVAAYQSYFGQEATGEINDIQSEVVQWHDGGDYPGQVTLDGQIQDGEEPIESVSQEGPDDAGENPA